MLHSPRILMFLMSFCTCKWMKHYINYVSILCEMYRTSLYIRIEPYLCILKTLSMLGSRNSAVESLEVSRRQQASPWFHLKQCLILEMNAATSHCGTRPVITASSHPALPLPSFSRCVFFSFCCCFHFLSCQGFSLLALFHSPLPRGSRIHSSHKRCQKRNITTIADVEMLIPSFVRPD